jgi:hypothetical protein
VSDDHHAKKFDQAKPDWSLFVWDAAECVVRVLEFGSRKYERDGWARVPDGQRRYVNAALRHLIAWTRGERVDPESGLPTLGHACCSALFALALGLRAAQPAGEP